jgi:hypothetical protein
MSFDLPASIERDLEQYAQSERITPVEAAVKFIQSGLKASKRKASKGTVDIDEQIRQLKALAPGTFGLLEDVPDEQIRRMEATISRMKRERFPARALGNGQHAAFSARGGRRLSANY